jgi:peroxiredoxin
MSMSPIARLTILALSACLGMVLIVRLCKPLKEDEPDTPQVVDADPHLGRAVTDFSLPDHRSKRHSLSDLADRPIVVVIFVGAQCPLAQLYAPRLAELCREYEPHGVAFLGINANAQDSLADVAAFVRNHRLPFPILKDPDHAVADLLGVQRTPEAFVLDGQRIVRYWGRIDDQHAVGVRGGLAPRRHLAEALDDLLAHRPVARPIVPSVGCCIGRVPRGTPRGEVTYSRHIRPLLEKRCVECHRPGEAAPFSLTDYRDAVAWSAMIREVVSEGRMPPWFASPQFGHFRNDARLSPAEKHLLIAWIDDHCPEGESRGATLSPKLSPGWRIPSPDQVLFMSAEAHRVPAEGEVEYEYFVIDPGFTEDRYLRAAEVRPGNRAVVHHALVALVPPGESRAKLDTLGALLDYAPGMPPMILPEGSALRIPAGSKLLFQMHYTPNGSPQQDRSYLGMVFADPRTVKRCVHGGAVINQAIDIPPGARDYALSAEHVLPEDVRLLSLSPHMHLRGKSFRVEAHFPDGRREVLLDVPRYDFNWQLRYDLAEAKALPRGTRLVCAARYDNSSSNPANPDPTMAVGWGDQTRDEMLICFFTFFRQE